MTDHTELKRLAEAVNQTYADLCEHGGDQLAEAWNSAELAYDDAANPDVVLALIAENEELGRYLCTCRDCGGEGSLHTGNWHSYSPMEPPEPVMEKCGECDGTGLLGKIQDLYQLITDRDQLRAEIDDLKAENVRLTEGCSELRGLFADAAEQCCKAERERDLFKTAYNEWMDKMAWARTWNSPSELGKHIADVTKGRVDALIAENETLRTALKVAESAMWKAESNMDNEAADIRDLLKLLSKEPSNG